MKTNLFTTACFKNVNGYYNTLVETFLLAKPRSKGLFLNLYKSISVYI